jgi:hypothetical protein
MTWTAALALALVTATQGPGEAPQTDSQDISLGVGWVVSQAGTAAAEYAADAEPAPTAEATSAAEPEPDPAAKSRPKAPPPRVRPFARHTDLDQRIREARRVRAISAGFAGAVMAATVVAGLVRAAEAQREMVEIRNAPRRSQFNPMHPR